MNVGTVPSNSIMDLKKYFSTDDKPCTNEEIREFWKLLTEEEKEYYRMVNIS